MSRWAINVELVFDDEPESDDVKERLGDGEVDRAVRALDCVRPALNSIAGKGKPFAGFYIIKEPHLVD